MGAFFSGHSLGCMEPSGSMASTGSCCQRTVLRQVLRATGENLRFPFSSNSMSYNLSQFFYLGLQGCLLVWPFVPIPLSATRILSIVCNERTCDAKLQGVERKASQSYRMNISHNACHPATLGPSSVSLLNPFWPRSSSGGCESD